jgi:hypothetical protein
MRTTRTTRILKFAASVLGFLLLGYVAFVAWALWDFRTHTYTIHGVPNALTDDAAAIRLSASVLRLHGADPAAFTAGTYWGGVTVGHNELHPNRVTTHWIHHAPGTPGLGVALEQHGSDVVCYVTRSK